MGFSRLKSLPGIVCPWLFLFSSAMGAMAWSHIASLRSEPGNQSKVDPEFDCGFKMRFKAAGVSWAMIRRWWTSFFGSLQS